LEEIMKKPFLIFVVLIALCAAACASASGSAAVGSPAVGSPAVGSAIALSTGPGFSEVLGKNWKLVQVRINGAASAFDRAPLGEGDSFTLTFDAERLAGKAAPNRYFSDYTLGGGQEITVKLIGSTKMASFIEPAALKEHDYLQYLQNAVRWDLVKGNLELSGKTDGADVTLVFTDK
jgi:heat shock protein HslJ